MEKCVVIRNRRVNAVSDLHCRGAAGSRTVANGSKKVQSHCGSYSPEMLQLFCSTFPTVKRKRIKCTSVICKAANVP